MYYIYAYIDPRNNLPFYIGKGKDTRKFDHLNENSSKKENKEKWHMIKELINAGTPPIILELESNIENELLAFNREDYYILKYGRRGIEENGILTNKTIGGKQPPIPAWSIEDRKRHSEFNKNYWTPERRKAHGLKTKGNNGGKATRGTVNVTDLFGVNKRISKDVYDNMDRSKDVNNWEYVSVSSKESKRRRQTNTP
jgi:hypothetical protein